MQEQGHQAQEPQNECDNLSIKSNKKLWFHRRLMTYTVLLFFIATFLPIIFVMDIQRILALKDIIIRFYTVCGAIICGYFILTTLHDKNILPQLISLAQAVKK